MKLTHRSSFDPKFKNHNCLKDATKLIWIILSRECEKRLRKNFSSTFLKVYDNLLKRLKTMNVNFSKILKNFLMMIILKLELCAIQVLNCVNRSLLFLEKKFT